jgi:hypothetical protein
MAVEAKQKEGNKKRIAKNFLMVFIVLGYLLNY